jgi:hypothetical protein
MTRNETLILIKNLPSTAIDGLDSIFEARGYRRTVLRTIDEDFTPLLSEEGGPIIFVLSLPQDDWIACWTSLPIDSEWEVAEELAQELEEPVACAVFSSELSLYMYRYWENGDLREEATAEMPDNERLDENALLAHLHRHGVAQALIDDRVDGYGQEHIVAGYSLMEQS